MALSFNEADSLLTTVGGSTIAGSCEVSLLVETGAIEVLRDTMTLDRIKGNLPLQKSEGHVTPAESHLAY